MSYLKAPRLHFAGQFGTQVSTVNNFATHFQNINNPNASGWNPSGSGSWGISGCTVRSAIYADGTVARTSADDPVVGMAFDQSGSARLVDLDPEQQLASQIWGMQLQLGATGPAFKGAFKTTAFSDIWPNRAQVPGRGDFKMSAFFHSVLTAVIWGDLSNSRLLGELKQASASGLLSIKFNVDGFDRAARTGRIVGTIGPAAADEPAHFVVGRQCMGSAAGPVWYFPALLDEQRGKLIADFGNALQTTSVGGPFDSTLDLQIGLVRGEQNFSSFGRVPIGPTGWYEQTAGICEFPADRSLSAAELDELKKTPIGVAQQTGGSTAVVASEGVDGLHVRADEFVYRLSAKDTAGVTLRASSFGRPMPNASIALVSDSSGLQQGPPDPEVGAPPVGLSFQANLTTDAKGLISAALTAGSIQKPRDYIDGQIYGVRYAVVGTDPETGSYFNPADFISVLVWTDYAAPKEPSWRADVQPILSQYANLYPVMKPIVDLSNYDSVVANKARMQMVFSLAAEDPRYMPVTRDLSPAKREMILNWLSTTGNAGKPNLDVTLPEPMHPALVAAAAPVEVHDDVMALGDKMAALQRRRNQLA
jgi:hypothetical protein